MGRIVLHAALGAQLVTFEVDLAERALNEVGRVTLPGRVQYAVPHASRRVLYVASTTGSCDANRPGRHHVVAMRIDERSGALSPLGAAVPLPSRPIHVTTDAHSDHLLVAHNDPPAVTVHATGPNGELGPKVPQTAGLRFGSYPHQVRVVESNETAIVVARGNSGRGSRAATRGSLQVFDLDDGRLTFRQQVDFGGRNGLCGFNPRHLDFPPEGCRVYVTLEAQNKLAVFALADRALSSWPLFVTETLADPFHVRRRQLAGAVHVHPNGGYVYCANRADATDGSGIFVGGENSIAVYAIDDATGEPVLVQNADTRGLHPRTFAIDPTGRLLVAANMRPGLVRGGAHIMPVPACLSLFDVGTDGRLDFVRKYGLDVGTELIWWIGMIPVPERTLAS